MGRTRRSRHASRSTTCAARGEGDRVPLYLVVMSRSLQYVGCKVVETTAEQDSTGLTHS